ncbi:hypothetical protein M8818_004165 [Zalaria obscura]|uniref:Uncharacterized protein n=1 Tax=Zalaria obscura TaxID=2024903 RepID=A0ACC3SCW4_9PEZI
MGGKTLVVLGSGPGIGVSTACAFSVRGFTHIALVSRNAERLKQDWDAVLTAIQERGYPAQVKTWVCDLCDLDALRKTLKEIENFGTLECVFYNAARVAGKPLLEEKVEQVEQDFKTANLALYETACWAIPLLQKSSSDSSRSPSIIVTSTDQLYKQPIPDLFSLSMTKAAQRNLVQSLHATYGKEIHIALLSVGGIVSPEKKTLSPENIADEAWALYKQPKSQWQFEVEVVE